MKHRSTLAVTAAAVAALGVAVSQSAFAGGDHAGKPGRAMAQQTGTMTPAGGRHGQMGGQGMNMHELMRMMHSKGGMMGGMGSGGMMGGKLFQSFDADDDGTVTPEEARAGLTGQLETYDANGDGTLSIEEFETLHAASIRSRMVDRFQALDEDGDGQVTGDEITAPAKRMERMQRARPGQASMQDQDDDDDQSDDSMMNRN